MSLLELPLSLWAHARSKRRGCDVPCSLAWQSNLIAFIAFALALLCQVLSFGSAFKFLVGYHGSSFVLFDFCVCFVVGFVLRRRRARG